MVERVSLVRDATYAAQIKVQGMSNTARVFSTSNGTV